MKHPKFDEATMKSADDALTETMKKARLKVSLGHDYIFDDHPIGVPWIAKWKVVMDESVATMCTNGRVLKYNPKFVDKLSTDAVKWVVLHEAMHLLLGHHVRRGDRNHRGYNVAGDLAINSLLREYIHRLDVWDELINKIKILMPREGDWVKFPHLKSAEWYYRELEKDIADLPEPPHGGMTEPCEDGEGGEGGDGGGAGSDDEKSDGGGDSEKSDDDGKGKGSGKGEGDEAGGDSDGGGSGDATSDGGEAGKPGGGKSMTEKFDEITGDSTVVGEVDDSPVIEEEGMDHAEAEYEETATQAVVLMKQQGRGAGYGIDYIENSIAKKAANNWAKLREYIHKSCLGGRNHKRPHRRRTAAAATFFRGAVVDTDIIFPSNRTKGKSKGAVITDTSGSMGHRECDEAIVQISKVLEEWPKAEITMVQCDATIHERGIREYSYNDLPLTIPREWLGRGGTDMQPAINWLKERKHDYDWAIFITDMGFCYDSMTESGVPTIFVGVNASPDITLPQRTYGYIPVIVE